VLPFGQATGLKSPRPEARGPQDNARGEDFAVLVLYFEPGRLSEILLLETWLTANHETLRVKLIQRLDIALAITARICGPDMRDG
jgi:hypothetical protein